ncbi:MAG TPA: DNA cytosine methyltransferase [Blastocatellia bacterium]|nr:DNA cytosine methyltransferase [Blastocatellia bacterium]
MKRDRVILAADLFCGAGGFTSGLVQASAELGVKLKMIAINHWDKAIETHQLNHPGIEHHCADIELIDPRKLVPGGRLNLLLASPECTHHSNARGGKPMDDQKRAQPWVILRWAEALYIDVILLENVREFRTRGPLGVDRRPVKHKKGEMYVQFLEMLKAIGYEVEDDLLCAADFGDPTKRERYFLIARRDRRPILWPRKTHSTNPDPGLFGTLKPYRPAREVINWEVLGESVFNRKKPLSVNTMRRVFVGLAKFSGLPFIVPNFTERPGQAPRTHSIEEPLPAVTGHGAGALVKPYLLNIRGGRDEYLRAGSIDEPLQTITTQSPIALVNPYLVQMYGASNAANIDMPLPTITAKGEHLGVCQPCIVGRSYVRHASGPGHSIPQWSGFGQDIRQGYLRSPGGRGGEFEASPNKSIAGLGAADRSAPIEPFLIKLYGGSDAASLDEPLPTITAEWNHLMLAKPFLLKYNSTGGARSLDVPLDTLTTKDRYALVVPQVGAVIDVLLRMLLLEELAAGMSFPREYVFVGTKKQRTRLIGNAVPIGVAKALCRAILESWETSPGRQPMARLDPVSRGSRRVWRAVA